MLNLILKEVNMTEDVGVLGLARLRISKANKETWYT